MKSKKTNKEKHRKWFKPKSSTKNSKSSSSAGYSYGYGLS